MLKSNDNVGEELIKLWYLYGYMDDIPDKVDDDMIKTAFVDFVLVGVEYITAHLNPLLNYYTISPLAKFTSDNGYVYVFGFDDKYFYLHYDIDLSENIKVINQDDIDAIYKINEIDKYDNDYRKFVKESSHIEDTDELLKDIQDFIDEIDFDKICNYFSKAVPTYKIGFELYRDRMKLLQLRGNDDYEAEK